MEIERDKNYGLDPDDQNIDGVRCERRERGTGASPHRLVEGVSHGKHQDGQRSARYVASLGILVHQLEAHSGPTISQMRSCICPRIARAHDTAKAGIISAIVAPFV